MRYPIVLLMIFLGLISEAVMAAGKSDPTGFYQGSNSEESNQTLKIRKNHTFEILTTVLIQDIDRNDIKTTTKEEGTWSQKDEEIFLSCECTSPFCFGETFSKMEIQIEDGTIKLLGPKGTLANRIVLFEEIDPNKSVDTTAVSAPR